MKKLDISITHLKYFYDASLAGSIVASAEKNFVTHSAISQGIKRLEQSLGIELMKHRKRNFQVTNEGKFLMSACENIFKSLNQLQDQVQLTSSEPSGELVFGSSHSLISTFLLKQFRPLKKKYPQMTVKFKLGKTPLVRSWVLNRDAEIGVTIDDGQLDGLDIIPIKTGGFVFVSKANYPSWASVEDVVLTEPRPETIALIKNFRQKFKKDLPIFNLVDSWELIAQMSESGDYTGFVPDFVAESRKLQITRPSPAIKYHLVIVYRKGEKLSRNSLAFIDHIRSEIVDN